MARDCAVNLDHVQTVPKAKLGPLVTTLNQEKLHLRVPETLAPPFPEILALLS